MMSHMSSMIFKPIKPKPIKSTVLILYTEFGVESIALREITSRWEVCAR
jgi:hypothetical protein